MGTAVRLVCGAASIALAISAQLMISGGRAPDEAIIRYALATAVFAASFMRVDAAVFAGGRLLRAPAAEDTPAARPAQRFLIAIAAVASGSGVARFVQGDNGAGWLLFAVGVGVFAAALIDRPRIAPGGHRPSALRLAALAAPVALLIGLTLAMRLPDLDRYPFGLWYDEGTVGVFARRILENPAFRPVCCAPSTLPAHFQYLAAASFSVFGANEWALRLVPVSYAVVTVVASYFLFRRWFGPGMGLVAAALWASMRYMIIWSRLGNDWLSPLPFETILLLLFDLALETKRLKYFGWAGLVMGLSLGFYYPTRLFFGVIAGFGLLAIGVWAIRRIAQRGRNPDAIPPKMALRQAAKIIATGALGLAIGGMPVIQFAATHWAEFTGRQANISIFSNRDEPDLGKAIVRQFEKHILMFNVRGDENPRHNLPGEPMLDPITGALAVLGLAHALTRFYRPANALALLTFAVMLTGAIFSLDYEAPQSLRAIGTQPALIYFAVTPLALLGKTAGPLGGPERLWRPVRLALSVICALGLAAVANYNYALYFGPQRNSADVYVNHSTAETIAAREMNRLGGDFDLIVPEAYALTPAVQFLAAGAVLNARTQSGSEPLLLQAGNRGFAILMEPRLRPEFDQLRRAYPGAVFRQFVPPAGGGPLLFEVLMSPASLDAAQGLMADVYPAGDFRAAPQRRIALSSASADWSANAPVAGGFGVELRGALQVIQDGPYGFVVQGPAGAELFIDEFSVSAEPILLARGLHAFRLRVPGAAAQFEALWRPPGASAGPIPASALLKQPASASGLRASYFANGDWQGTPAFTQIEPEIDYTYHILPLPRPYSIEWTGSLFAPEDGVYAFSTESRDESDLLVDGDLIIANRAAGAPVNAPASLSAGWHEIRLRFADRTTYSQMRLYWTVPGKNREIIPFRHLAPPLGAYPAALPAFPEPAPITGVVAQ